VKGKTNKGLHVAQIATHASLRWRYRRLRAVAALISVPERRPRPRRSGQPARRSLLCCLSCLVRRAAHAGCERNTKHTLVMLPTFPCPKGGRTRSFRGRTVTHAVKQHLTLALYIAIHSCPLCVVIGIARQSMANLYN
jgi:hypothetical protein